MVVDWGNIPKDIATKIVEHAELYEDYESFKFVCSNWRSAAKEAKFRGSATVAWLMLPEDNPSSKRRRFYSLQSHRFRHVDLPLPPHSNDCEDMRLLSSRGWLLSVSDRCKNITLLNPLSGAAIQLPMVRFYNKLHERGFPTPFSYSTNLFEKFILSANPSTTSDFTIAMILDEPFANLCCWHNVIVFWSNNAENNQWIPLSETKSVPSQDMRLKILHNCHDICFFQGQVYGVDSGGKLLQFDLNHDIPQAREVSSLFKRGYIPCRYGYYNDSDRDPDRALDNTLYYVLESDGKLLHVSRVKTLPEPEDYYRTTWFRVIELNVDDGTATEVLDLGTRAIFVGSSSSSFSIEASGYGCKPNSIYYTDEVRSFDYEFGLKGETKGKDIGVYDLKTGEIECFDKGITPQFNELTPLMWVESPYPLQP